MMGVPMIGNLFAGANPYIVWSELRLGKLNKIGQTRYTSRSGQTTMQSNTHHGRISVTTFLDGVLQRIFQICSKCGASGKVGWRYEPHIVFTQCVWDDQVGLIIIHTPIRQIVRIRIRIVFESAHLSDQISCPNVGLRQLRSSWKNGTWVRVTSTRCRSYTDALK